MACTLPFDPPKLVTARRSSGVVGFQEDKNCGEEQWNGERSILVGNSTAIESVSSFGPTHLQRQKTLAGNIVIFEPDSEPPQAFWLQRKMGQTSNGVIRLGYRLRRSTKPSFKDSKDAWEMDVDEAGEATIVRILIMHSSVLDMKCDNQELQSPLDYLSALQMIAQNNNTDEAHVLGAHLMGACSSFVYAVSHYYPDGTLLQHCQGNGSLEEPIARFFFTQILKGLKVLQETGLCHRHLSLDAVTLRGDQLVIDRLEWCMRFSKNNPIDEDKAAPIPGGNNPQYVAPEYFGCLTGGWDGFAADLWACGLMLYSMVVSSEALFVAPLREDKTFVDLCVNGRVGECVNKYSKSVGREIVLSDELVNLLQTMLQADPKKRYSLDDVMNHPWVINEDMVAPTGNVENK